MAEKVPPKSNVWASNMWGVKPMMLTGPFTKFQSRVSPDGEFMRADRQWRAQWLKDQVLSSKDAATHR